VRGPLLAKGACKDEACKRVAGSAPSRLPVRQERVTGILAAANKDEATEAAKRETPAEREVQAGVPVQGPSVGEV
jgi:hypothetical protein